MGKTKVPAMNALAALRDMAGMTDSQLRYVVWSDRTRQKYQGPPLIRGTGAASDAGAWAGFRSLATGAECDNPYTRNPHHDVYHYAWLLGRQVAGERYPALVAS